MCSIQKRIFIHSKGLQILDKITIFNHMFALVDCNNFYVSCERVFQPQLEKKTRWRRGRCSPVRYWATAGASTPRTTSQWSVGVRPADGLEKGGGRTGGEGQRAWQ